MNQPNHAWLAVEAYRKIEAHSKTEIGRKKKLDGLARLLGASLGDVVVAAWLPDSLIKDMTYGHIFKNSTYKGNQRARFILGEKELLAQIPSAAQTPKIAFGLLPDEWWREPYRVKAKGGHLPARVNALCQTARDMLKMGDADVVELTGVKKRGTESIDPAFRSSPRDVAMMLWMASHYIADAHMPFHCDNRALASTAKQDTHCDIEKLWGKQVPTRFDDNEILNQSNDAILTADLPPGSKFAGIDFGSDIPPLRNNGDPWKEAVYICRASFATSFAFVPPHIAGVDDQTKSVSLEDILTETFCGEARFWELSRAIMADAASSIAMFWNDVWLDFVKP
jgi:hypothetical protein